jgi:hypothetical protein
MLLVLFGKGDLFGDDGHRGDRDAWVVLLIARTGSDLMCVKTRTSITSAFGRECC